MTPPPWWQYASDTPPATPKDEPPPGLQPEFKVGDIVRLRARQDKPRRVFAVEWHRYRHQFVYRVETNSGSDTPYWFAAQLIAD